MSVVNLVPRHRVGYVGMNRTLKLSTGHTLRLSSYSEKAMLAKTRTNLSHMQQMLEYNAKNGIQCFRIGSNVVPFASHQVCTTKWWETLRTEFAAVGKYALDQQMRISIHPDHFVILNSGKPDLTQKSVQELLYHCRLLDAMGLDSTHKMQIHVGGLYGDKPSAKSRFIAAYKALPDVVKQRLVIENDDRLFTVADCLDIHRETGIPILFDNLHHECNNNGESVRDAFLSVLPTWNPARDGRPLVDYSSQQPAARMGNHAETLNDELFRRYLTELRDINFDIILEIKDKESSALRAAAILDQVHRLDGAMVPGPLAQASSSSPSSSSPSTSPTSSPPSIPSPALSASPLRSATRSPRKRKQPADHTDEPESPPFVTSVDPSDSPGPRRSPRVKTRTQAAFA